MDALPPNWINLGIAGLLAVAFIAAHMYTIKTVIPNMLTTFREELAIERAANATNIDKLAGRLGKVEEAINGLGGQEPPRHPFAQTRHP